MSTKRDSNAIPTRHSSESFTDSSAPTSLGEIGSPVRSVSTPIVSTPTPTHIPIETMTPNSGPVIFKVPTAPSTKSKRSTKKDLKSLEDQDKLNTIIKKPTTTPGSSSRSQFRTSSSGRVLIPPTQFWRNQHVRTDALGRVVEVTQGSTATEPTSGGREGKVPRQARKRKRNSSVEHPTETQRKRAKTKVAVTKSKKTTPLVKSKKKVATKKKKQTTSKPQAKNVGKKEKTYNQNKNYQGN